MTQLPFDAFTLAAVFDDLEQVRGIEQADAIEFRMDLSRDPLEQLEQYDGNLPLIATNRASWEGGGAPAENRLVDLEAAAKTDAVGAIDVELESIEAGDAKRLLEVASEFDVSVIASWHDFDRTPPRAYLEERLRQAATVGDVGKVAVMATRPRDVLDLLAATETVSEEETRVATMSMGAIGRHSRVIAPIYGSRIGYAPVDPEDATAPGQFDLDTLHSLIRALSNGSSR